MSKQKTSSESIINISNFLSFLRILLAPVLVVLVLKGQFYFVTAIILFSIASVTDYFDGYCAKKFNVHTNFGAFVDPLADKILVLSLFLAFYLINTINLYVVLPIILRDVVVTGIRISAINQGYTFVTSRSAKYKTSLQMLIIYLLFFISYPKAFTSNVMILEVVRFCYAYYIISLIMTVIVLFTVWTGVSYLMTNKAVLVQMLYEKER